MEENLDSNLPRLERANSLPKDFQLSPFKEFPNGRYLKRGEPVFEIEESPPERQPLKSALKEKEPKTDNILKWVGLLAAFSQRKEVSFKIDGKRLNITKEPYSYILNYHTQNLMTNPTERVIPTLSADGHFGQVELEKILVVSGKKILDLSQLSNNDIHITKKNLDSFIAECSSSKIISGQKGCFKDITYPNFSTFQQKQSLEKLFKNKKIEPLQESNVNNNIYRKY